MNTSRLGALLLGLVLTTTLTARAQLFGTEQRLYPHVVASVSNNAIVHASGNNVYVAWSTYSSATNNSDIWVKVSTNNGTSFGSAINVSNGGGHPNIGPVIVGDGTNVHVFWTDDVAGEDPAGANQHIGRIFYARSTDNGSSFGAAQSIVDQAGYSRVTAALISGSQVHLAFYDNRLSTSSSVGKVFHKLSCDSGATWSTETNVTQFDGDVDNEQPRLAQLSSGEIFLSFRSSRAGVPQGGWPPFQTYLLRMNTASCPSGATWVYPAQRLSRGSELDLGGNYGVNIFPGANGGMHAAWWNDTAGTNLVYRLGKPNGEGFGPQRDLSGFGLNHLQWEHMTERTGFGIGEDATGQVHAMFLQNSSTRGGFQTGSLWYRCSPAPVGSAFVAKQLVGGSALASEPRASYSNGRFHMVWQDYRNTAIDQSEIYYNYVNTNTTCTAPAPSAAPALSAGSIDFGGNSMQTTSYGMPIQLTGTGGSISITGATTSSPNFTVVSNNCATLTSGASCAVYVNFTPTAQGALSGTLNLTYSAGGAGQTLTVSLNGVGERSLVTHFYRAILNRIPPDTDKAYWEGEAVRLSSLGVDINETWYVMAGYFFNSPEYKSSNKDNTQYVTDLYNTFFNRTPDAGGLGYWVGQIQQGLPREVVLFYFMFSPEFRSFTNGIFGSTASPPEINMVVDFFRGLLNRLPDTISFNYWLGRLRTAQCAGAGAVYTEVGNISRDFMYSPEYGNRARNNSQFVTDMYYSFLRRYSDLGGFNFWVDELASGRRSADTVRTDFIASAEFGARVTAVINAGCPK